MEAGKNVSTEMLSEKPPVMKSLTRKENTRFEGMVADLVLRYDIVKKLRHAGLTHQYRKYMRLSAGENTKLFKRSPQSEIA